MQRSKQKILVLRDNLTSYTQATIIEKELKDNLCEALITLAYNIRNNNIMEIRVDTHTSFQALQEDEILEDNKIKLVVGDEKNVNKNSVAEKAIQELEDELAKLSPGRNMIGNIVLSKAVFALNSRIRYT